jgi:hypothetical protein
MMNPDGFFVVNIGQQWIETSITNTSGADLANVRVYIEGISDPGISRISSIYHAGSPRVSLIVEADGHDFRRFLKKIFVTRVDYDKTSKTYSVVMPQDVTYDWMPSVPYEGERGPFPYEGPWWKIALAILAALLLAGALLSDYFSDGTLDGGMVSVSGTFDGTDPSVSCCTDVTTSAIDPDDLIAQGLYSSVRMAAMAAIASDGPDLHYCGQAATVPPAGELTVGERVHLEVEYVELPNLGQPFSIRGKWEYTRTTTGDSYSHSDSDERKNIHWLDSYEVNAPAIHDRLSGLLVVKARFVAPGGKALTGNQLCVTAVLVNTMGILRRFELQNHGIGPDDAASDGTYTGQIYLRPGNLDQIRSHVVKYDPPGTWYLFVFAQDVNTVLAGTAPYDAAHAIGGFVVTDQLELAFDQPCQLRHDAVIQVL